MSDLPRTYTLAHMARPWSVNDQVRWHWSTRARNVRDWRLAFYLLAKQRRVPRLGTIHVTAQTTTSGRLFDVGNEFYTVKAAVDGLVDAGVVVDDGPRYVRSLTLLAPTHGPDRLVLTIEEAR